MVPLPQWIRPLPLGTPASRAAGDPPESNSHHHLPAKSQILIVSDLERDLEAILILRFVPGSAALVGQPLSRPVPSAAQLACRPSGTPHALQPRPTAGSVDPDRPLARSSHCHAMPACGSVVFDPDRQLRARRRRREIVPLPRAHCCVGLVFVDASLLLCEDVSP
jgi:hypothetical protein